ncbi:MAG: OmpA family protein [Deltaproteobacteria bacterium]|jgi:outer membrane protein OmpA-like peptidoglycan-associated protein|nr:OmpA family protein [Deltaproteobacteria bacterium]
MTLSSFRSERTRRRTVGGLTGSLALLAAVGISSTAAAQTEMALNQYQPSVAGDDFLAVPQADVGGHLLPHAQLIFDYARNPFVIENEDGDRLAEPVTGQIFLHLGASLSLWDRLLVSASFPLALMQSGDDTTIGAAQFSGGGGVAAGDLRLGLRGRIYGERDDAFQFGAGAFLFPPTGSSDYSGDGSFYGEPHLLANGRIDRFRYSASLGIALKASDNPHSFTFRAAGGVMLLDGKLLIGPELFGAVNTADGTFFEGTSSPIERAGDVNAELLGSVQYRLPFDFVVGAGAGPGIAEGVGTPQLRILARVMWDPQPKPPAQPGDRDGDGILDRDDACPDMAGPPNADRSKHGCPLDSDGDGILDVYDACPSVAGEPNEDQAKHGCPPPSDRDGDGILDDVDACIDQPGPSNEDPAKHGCPPPSDHDGDGIADLQDACPRVPGQPSSDPAKNGCPLDSDGDGILDRDDACPKQRGIQHKDPKRHGCPRVTVTDGEVWILQKVEFDTNRATIKPVSDELLDDVAKTLNAHPELKRLEVQGHTDDQGPDAYNQLLSQRRSEAVRNALVQRGVDGARLTAKGYGESKPIASNDTDEGRATNRRVQFKILERSTK